MSITCPKCGFEQKAGEECLRCGVIFKRYNAADSTGVQEPVTEQKRPPGLFRRVYKVVSLVTLIGLIVSVLLLLRTPDPPSVQTEPGDDRRLRLKLSAMEDDLKKGQPHTLRLNEGEVNTWVSSNLAIGPGKEADPKRSAPAIPSEENATLEEVQSSVRDVKIDFDADLVRVYTVFDYHGKDLTFTLEGRLHAQNGYLRLQPTSGAFGSLPLPKAALDRAVAGLLGSPENREKFKLPPQVADVRIQDGQLVVVYR